MGYFSPCGWGAAFNSPTLARFSRFRQVILGIDNEYLGLRQDANHGIFAFHQRAIEIEIDARLMDRIDFPGAPCFRGFGAHFKVLVEIDYLRSTT